MVASSFLDPLYGDLARAAEQRYGLPQGILDALRTRGEKSNAGEVSSAGGRSVYQFIPATRQGMIKNYGVDPWKDEQSATTAAALLLKENHSRTGSWDKAVTQYHGGLNPHNYGPRTRAYGQRVGSFDNKEPAAMLGQSLYPAPYYGGTDPLAPEPVKDTVPLSGDPGPSIPVAAGSPVVAHKRGGILGSIGRALGSVFMPEPDSRWAGALRDGLVNAKESQQNYRTKQQADTIASMTATAKLKALLTKGEYQVVGNNVFHIPADGSDPEMITPPTTPSETERLVEKWSKLPDGDPMKDFLHRILLKGNDSQVIAEKGTQAQQTARIRATAKPKTATVKGPPARFILDE